MAQLYLLAYMLANLLGTPTTEVACWQANPQYTPREQYAAACVLNADDNPYTAKPAVTLDWDGTIRILPLAG